jgi:hypothetical protein
MIINISIKVKRITVINIIHHKLELYSGITDEQVF